MSGDITESRDGARARKSNGCARASYKRAEGAAPRSAAHTGADSAWATMWRKAFQAVLCWLALCDLPAATGKTVSVTKVKDTVSAESAPRLYRNVPFGVYASAAPYAAYSFHLPAFIAAPKPAASQNVPVKEQLVLHNVNGYLRDSYGNKFVGTPQSAAYKTAIPQQFLPLQELPAHLSQPLLAAPQSKQAAPHYFVGSPYSVPTLQVASRPPTNGFQGFSQPFILAQNYGGVSPSQAAPTAQTAPSHTQAITAQHQPSSNKAVYANTHSVEHYQQSPKEEKFQRIEHKPEGYHYAAHARNADHHEEPHYEKHHHEKSHHEKHHSEKSHHGKHHHEKPHHDKAQLQDALAKTSFSAVVNGKKTVITLDTKPPVPLLDLSLLEPLTFANPLVPQVQHFLPRINQATYHKLPDFNGNEPKHHKKSYDNGNHKVKQSPKKKPKQTVHNDNHHKPRPAKPTITVQGTPNKSPEFSYEINSPNYKETYKEQSVSYNTAKESDPVSYTYDKKTESEPVTYSYQKIEQKPPVHYNFVHSSKDPLQIKQVNYQVQGQGPKQLVYTFKPEEQHREQKHVDSDDGSAEDSGSSEESGDDAPPPRPLPTYPQNHYKNQVHYKEAPRIVLKQGYYPRHQGHSPQHHYRQNAGIRFIRPNNIISHRSNGSPQIVSNEEEQFVEYRVEPQENAQQVEAPVQQEKAQFHHPHEIEENIRLAPSEAPNDDFTKQIESYQNPQPVHLSSLDQYKKFVEQQTERITIEPNQQYSTSAPFVLEKAKRIIVQEESPEEVHTHDEQIKAEMIDQENNNEEDFEKAYKNAAFGFEAFDKKAKDIEKDVYNPDSYGYAGEHVDFDVEKTPFQDYQAEGDSFPKSSRANYKDARDNTKEDYYLDYSVNRPESLADRYQNKANYFKLYKNHKPEKYFAADKDKKKSGKYTVAPSFDFGSEKKQNYFARFKAEPEQYGYSYAKEAPRDNSAHASHPYQRLKSKTHFVEPQFQYGFEPIGLPRLLDSELAAMASNVSPESEKPGMRKKIYKENWYIKKTSTTGGS